MKRVILDTNIYGYFLARKVELKNGTFKEPKIIEFLKGSDTKFEYYVSIATRAEIIRRLVSELGLGKETSASFWTAFLAEIKAEEILKKCLKFYPSVISYVQLRRLEP